MPLSHFPRKYIPGRYRSSDPPLGGGTRGALSQSGIPAIRLLPAPLFVRMISFPRRFISHFSYDAAMLRLYQPHHGRFTVGLLSIRTGPVHIASGPSFASGLCATFFLYTIRCNLLMESGAILVFPVAARGPDYPSTICSIDLPSLSR